MNKYTIDRLCDDIRIILNFNSKPAVSLGRYKVVGSVASGVSSCSGKHGKAYSFPAISGAMIKFSDDTPFNMKRQTLLFYIKPTSYSQGTGYTFHAIIDHCLAYHCCLHYDSAPYTIHRFTNAGGGRDWGGRDRFMHPGKWYFVITTYDGIAGKVWIDGFIRKTVFDSYAFIPYRDLGTSIGDQVYTGRPMKGDLDFFVLAGAPMGDSKAYTMSKYQPSFDANNWMYQHVHTDSKGKEVGVVSSMGVL